GLCGEGGEKRRGAGGEWGAAPGGPRGVGGFDIPASRYGVLVQGADELALTKLDVLSYLERIPVCVKYEVNGEGTELFPSGDALMKAKPVYEYLTGWQADISKCRRPEDLPDAAAKYIRFIEAAVGCPVRYVSVGAGRDDYFMMG
ncbi:MAG: adenylosuccinate synthetase, partial [Oscillospiraceae bacterium]|nr:adenylosuccinate synthetase [Oscillospiraceae bacterium]